MMKYNPNHTIMSETILTNEWYDAAKRKPWNDRLVLVRFSDGTFHVAKWDGTKWVGQAGMCFFRTETITHFYIFEKYNEKSITQ